MGPCVNTTKSTHFFDVDETDLVSCVSCGLCLPHCPTYRISGRDEFSPRGRISLVNAVRSGELELTDAVASALESCVQCMGCLPACPSGVRYDRIIEPVMAQLAAQSLRRRLLRSLTLMPLGRPHLLRLASRMAFVAQKTGLLPSRLGLPQMRWRRRPTAARHASAHGTATDRPVVELFVGCVMNEWYSDVHEASIAVLEDLGYDVITSDPRDCCGALHRHAGLVKRAEAFEHRFSSRDGEIPLLVNSAGCGAHLATLTSRARDLMTFVDDALSNRVWPHDERVPGHVVAHDACHSRNLLGSHVAAHRAMSRFVEVSALPDDGLCCGAGGAYSLSHPDEASRLAERKFDAVRSVLRADTFCVSSANPGCTGHLISHRPGDVDHLRVLHPIQIVARGMGVLSSKFFDPSD